MASINKQTLLSAFAPPLYAVAMTFLVVVALLGLASLIFDYETISNVLRLLIKTIR